MQSSWGIFTRIGVATIAVLGLAAGVRAQTISLTTNGGTYTQNFDGLASTGTGLAFPPASLTGWQSNQATYLTGSGTNNAGGLYSFGSTGSSDRALGSIASNGTNSIFYGAVFTNNTGVTLTQFTLRYTGEQWRDGGTATTGVNPPQNRLNFGYFLGTNTIAGTGFTEVDALDFLAPKFTQTITVLDGNDPANRATLSATIQNLTWASGTNLIIRWEDINDANNDQGLAIDDLSLTAFGPTGGGSAIPEPSTLALAGVALLPLARRRRRTRR